VHDHQGRELGPCQGDCRGLILGAAGEAQARRTHDKLLPNQILDEEKLKFDREGNRRTAYSLRHTYICLRLMEGADIYQIARTAAPSVEMIEKFYASHIKTTLDAAAINVRKVRPLKATQAGTTDERAEIDA
jgi:hypothetical protein